MDQALKYSLKIVYGIKSRYEAAYISEFFKMCGFFVFEKEVPEDVKKYETLTQDVEQFEHVLFLGIDSVDFDTYFAMDLIRNAEYLHKMDAHEHFLDAYGSDTFSLLNDWLEEMADVIRPGMGVSFRPLIEFYVRNHYCRLSYIKRYFGKVVGVDGKKELRQAFLSFIQELERIPDGSILPYCRYTQYLCARKVNDICMQLQLSFHFPPKLMIEKCLRILDDAPEFFNAYVLAASFATCDASLGANVIPFYQNVLRGHENHPALVNTYYRLGQYYEKHRDDMKNANQAYDRAVEIVPDYFRALFKEGGKLLDSKKYASAIDMYTKIIQKLNVKRSHNLLFPVEYEYLCKCYLLLGLIYQRYWTDQVNEENQYRSAVKLVEQELEDSSFFQDFFGDRQGIYLKLLREKIALNEFILVDKYR